MAPIRKPYPSDVTDEEWSLVAPYLTLMDEGAPQRQHSLRELFNGLRYVLRYGIAWRAMPNDLPPWSAVYQQSQRWLAAGVFEALAQDLRGLLRVASGRAAEPTAAIIDSRTLRSTPESGPRAGYDGAKRKRGSKLHLAVDTLGHLLALHVTPANVDDRAEVGKLAAAVQEATGESVELIYIDQGYTGENAAEAAKAQGAELCVVKPAEAKKGFVLYIHIYIYITCSCRLLPWKHPAHASSLTPARDGRSYSAGRSPNPTIGVSSLLLLSLCFSPFGAVAFVPLAEETMKRVAIQQQLAAVRPEIFFQLARRSRQALVDVAQIVHLEVSAGALRQLLERRGKRRQADENAGALKLTIARSPTRFLVLFRPSSVRREVTARSRTRSGSATRSLERKPFMLVSSAIKTRLVSVKEHVFASFAVVLVALPLSMGLAFVAGYPFKSAAAVGLISGATRGVVIELLSEGAPQAQEIADRFHILQNLLEAVQTQLGRAVGASARPLLPVDGEEVASVRDKHGGAEQSCKAVPFR